MKDSVKQKLTKLTSRFEEIREMLYDPEIINDIGNFTKINKESAELKPVIEAFGLYNQYERDLTSSEEMLKDPELKEFAQEELAIAKKSLEDIELTIQKLLLPKDNNDECNVYLEIRAGSGGDESALFAGSVFRMYSRYAERNGWQMELVSEAGSDIGGYKEVIARIIGAGVYARLKFESGVHRVQRIPSTEANGRIHTSACTVAIMAEADEVSDVIINTADLRIDTYRASGAGGQHVNKTDSAIRITHLPTGIVVECQDERSQHKNKARALSLLATRIKDVQVRKQQAEISATRKSLVGSGDRSERIRTYNFPQGRMTDHRINLTLYKLDMIMDGDLEETTNALINEHQAELLSSMGNDE